MVADEAVAESFCHLDSAECDLLRSPSRPIVLLRKRSGINIAHEVAPTNPNLGIMLPYTPLHHLLLSEMGGTPLVMTSGNSTDEPIAYMDSDATKRLAGIADLFLSHNRPIQVRCEDSVTRCIEGSELPIRRSRGYAPRPITLPMECSLPILAVGGQLKGTFALGRGPHAILSHHLGDLDHFDAYKAFVKDISLYEQLFSIHPSMIAHDLHPDYASTRYALERMGDDSKSQATSAGNLRLIPVQHHHAHMASCMAEHGLAGPVIGVSFDGTGYGIDEKIWGGEFLIGNYREFRRAAHLRYVPMPGGDQAIREPWRMALAHLLDASESDKLLAPRLKAVALRTARTMIDQDLNSPLTSSVGRLFDAVATLAMERDRVTYEGQAAMELEWLADGVVSDSVYPFDFVSVSKEESFDQTWLIDTRPIIRSIAEDVRMRTRANIIARRFHSTMVEMIAIMCDRIRSATSLEEVVLSGGVFMNVLLTRETVQELRRRGFRVYCHRLVPPNDGGLCLGQLAIAAQLINPDFSPPGQ